MALPELPDDWRARPRRHDADDVPDAPRHSRGVPPAGRHAASAPDGLPGRPWTVDDGRGAPGPYGAPETDARYRSGDQGYGSSARPGYGLDEPTGSTPQANGHTPGHGFAEPGSGYLPAGPRDPAAGHPFAGNGYGGEPPRRAGDSAPLRARRDEDPRPRNGSPGETTGPLPPGGPGTNGHRAGYPGADDATVALPAVPPAPPARAPESDVPPPRRSATRPGIMSTPVQRPAADEDPPTVALRGDEADSVLDDAVPGRHRRRASEQAEGRPAAEYRAEAAAAGHPTRGGRRRRPAFWKELPILVVVALLLTFLIQTFVAKVYVIPSGSMETTLHGCTGCTNDRVLVDKVTYRFSDPRPGDVVVFRGPDGWTSEFTADPPANVVVAALQQLGSLVGLAPPDEKDFIKRVIAVGGQTVQCCDSRNRVLVNDEPLDEPYIYYLPEAGPARQDSFGPVTVPAGELWMMGDSRNNSADSRVAGHGAVPVSDVIGKARFIVLPFGRFGGVPDPNPQATPVGMGGDAGAPLALGLVGVLPLVALRRRRRDDFSDEFLPRD